MHRLSPPNTLKILLLSTYEIGRQPFGLASPAAWLRREGFSVTCADCALNPLPEDAVREAHLVAFYVPMHTATRLALPFLRRVKAINPGAHICFYGLYAPMNKDFLRRQGVDTILGGEFEEGLVSLCQRLKEGTAGGASGNGFPAGQIEPLISLNRQQFIKPDRQDLPPLSRYARLCCENCPPKITGYVEASRGCKYHCRHCPVVPIYNGRFRVVQKEVVLADIRQQVEMGAEHITFGDPDFFNGPGHALPIISALHEEFPSLTYDVTIKVEHLLKYRRHLPLLRETGCALVTTAVESFDNRVLQILDKGHTREDFIRVIELFDEVGLALNPTFVPFTPWITMEGYREFLSLLSELNLIENISPIQLAIRLLIPAGSKLMELEETRRFIGDFNEELLTYEWQHRDPRVDHLQREIMALVASTAAREKKRKDIFNDIWDLVNETSGKSLPLPGASPLSRETKERISRAAIPYLNEPWYC